MVVAEREVKTERLLLRPLRVEDAEDVFALRSNYEVMKYSSVLPHSEISQTREWIEDCLARENCYNYAIELVRQPPGQKLRVFGVIGAVRTPEIGYLIHPDFWGKGYATEAMRAFMPLYWDHVEGRYDYATAIVDPDHVASQNILNKLGFSQYETREKDFESPYMGLRDSVYYRLFRPGTSVENAKGLS